VLVVEDDDDLRRRLVEARRSDDSDVWDADAWTDGTRKTVCKYILGPINGVSAGALLTGFTLWASV